jgi:DNA-binding sugar fermentation-stimulating protein
MTLCDLASLCWVDSLGFNMMTFAIPKHHRKSLHTASHWTRNFKNSAKRMDFLLTKRKLQIIYEFLKQYRITK